jgi:hypothetical protein
VAGTEEGFRRKFFVCAYLGDKSFERMSTYDDHLTLSYVLEAIHFLKKLINAYNIYITVSVYV